MSTVPKRVVREIIRQEVAAVIVHLAIPTTAPWSYLRHPRRRCGASGCGDWFAPKRWFSRFCSRECGAAYYRMTVRSWRKRHPGGRPWR